MIDINSIFPFLSRAEQLSNRNEDIPVRNVLTELDGSTVEGEIGNIRRVMTGFPRSKKWEVLELYPSNIRVFLGYSHLERLAVWGLKQLEPDAMLPAEIRVVDYAYLAQHIEVDPQDHMVYLYHGPYFYQVNITEGREDVFSIISAFSNKFVDDVSRTVERAWYSLPRRKLKMPKTPVVAEAFMSSASWTKPKPTPETKDPIEVHLKNYLMFRSKSERIPLLLGNTAVAKSSVIKQLAGEFPHNPASGTYGYRVVDFRCAFIDKLDIEGLVLKTPDGKFTYNAPMELLYRCTDEYLSYVREALVTIRERLEADFPDSDLITDDTEAPDVGSSMAPAVANAPTTSSQPMAPAPSGKAKKGGKINKRIQNRAGWEDLTPKEVHKYLASIASKIDKDAWDGGKLLQPNTLTEYYVVLKMALEMADGFDWFYSEAPFNKTGGIDEARIRRLMHRIVDNWFYFYSKGGTEAEAKKLLSALKKLKKHPEMQDDTRFWSDIEINVLVHLAVRPVAKGKSGMALLEGWDRYDILLEAEGSVTDQELKSALFHILTPLEPIISKINDTAKESAKNFESDPTAYGEWERQWENLRDSNYSVPFKGLMRLLWVIHTGRMYFYDNSKHWKATNRLHPGMSDPIKIVLEDDMDSPEIMAAAQILRIRIPPFQTEEDPVPRKAFERAVIARYQDDPRTTALVPPWTGTADERKIRRDLRAKEARRKAPSTKKDALEKLYATYLEESRTPILFFDEITRAPMSVRNAFTTILNQKKFQGREMSIARLVAATNYPVDMSEDLAGIFETDEIDDVATLDRFESIPVTPKDVFPRWMRWAKQEKKPGRPNIHGLITSYIETAYGDDARMMRAYDFEYAVRSAGDDIDKVSITPFPNYRTWEMVSHHLYAVDDGKCTFNAKIVKNLIGNDPGDNLITHINSHNPSMIAAGANRLSGGDKDDELTTGVEECMASGVPMLMVGVSGIGKTTRVNNYCRNNAEQLDINLAHVDRTTVMGTPVTADPLSLLNGDSREVLGEKDPIFGELSKIAKGKDIPSAVSRFAPDLNIAKKAEAAAQKGRPLVLFFDEVNRGNSTVWSAVFEAVSDHRYGGVEFPEDLEVKVVCAANFGEAYQDVNRLDPAFAARFCIFNHPEITDEDVEAIKNYWRSIDYDRRIMDFLDTLSPDEFKDLIRSVESRTMEKSASSTRGFSDFNSVLKTFGKTVMSGRLIDGDKFLSFSVWLGVTEDRDDGNYRAILDDLITNLNRIPANWAAYNQDDTIDFASRTYTAAAFVREAKQTAEEWSKAYSMTDETQRPDQVKWNIDAINNIKESIRYFNDRVAELRKHQIVSILGPGTITENLIIHYNNATGEERIELHEVKTPDLAEKWVEQEITPANPSDYSEKAAAIAREYHDFWKNKKPKLHTEILKALFSAMKAVHQQMYDFIAMYRSDTTVAAFFQAAASPKADRDIVEGILGLAWDEDQAKAYYKKHKKK